MLRFFRKIRFQLLGENKVLRYLAYAVGEIFLVVIGILIALQVNNWNEARKDRQDELEILREIHANLQGDLQEFELGIDIHLDKKNACQDLLNIVKKDLPYDESYGYYLNYLRIYPRFDSNGSGYQLLKTKGLDLIRNDELRYYSMLSREKELRNIMYSDIRTSLKRYEGLETLKVAKKPDSLTISEEALQQGRYRNMINFDRFKEDTEFHWILKDLEISATVEIRRYENAKKEVEALLKLLEEVLR